LFDLF